MQNNPQDFVDALNFKEFPQMGYKLVDGYWQHPDGTKYPSNESVRNADNR